MPVVFFSQPIYFNIGQERIDKAGRNEGKNHQRSIFRASRLFFCFSNLSRFISFSHALSLPACFFYFSFPILFSAQTAKTKEKGRAQSGASAKNVSFSFASIFETLFFSLFGMPNLRKFHWKLQKTDPSSKK